jgi:hypothetical protein
LNRQDAKTPRTANTISDCRDAEDTKLLISEIGCFESNYHSLIFVLSLSRLFDGVWFPILIFVSLGALASWRFDDLALLGG